MRKIDLTNERIGKLTVVRKHGIKRYKSHDEITWLCKCDCGKFTVVDGSNLRRPNGTKSCGCLAVERSREFGKARGNQDMMEGRKLYQGTDISSLNDSISSLNTSGVKGIHFASDKAKWCVRISVKGKRMHLGYYDDFNDAIKVRKDAEESLWKPILSEYKNQEAGE